MTVPESRPPLIGLPGRRKKANEVADYHPALGDLDFDLYLADYSRGVAEAGGIPVNIPVDSDIATLIPHLDGVVLTGGTDVDPTYYGADPHPQLLRPELERDELEFALFAGAVEHGLPVLGICRGLQVINVHQGGTLHQHVEAHSRYDVPSDAEIHPVTFAEGSMLASLYGPSRPVNSLHHQTVDAVGEDLVVTATADDGTVEGLELGDSVIAVQWHPELLAGRPTDPAFRWLVESAARHR